MYKHEVKGYGIADYGVEWGLEWFDKEETFMFYVADNNDTIYVKDEKEAQELCEDLIKQWEE